MKFLKPFLLCLVFLTSQALFAHLFGLVALLLSLPFSPFSPVTLSLVALLSCLFTVGVAWRWQLVHFQTLRPHAPRSWSRTLLVILLTLLLSILFNLLSELLQLPDNNGRQLFSMLRHPLGAFAIVVAVPVVEELIFRESIIGGLLRAGLRPAWALLLSALVFGLAHLNPAQIPYAVVMGLIYGVIYLRFRNILLTSFLHILNNGLALLLLLLYGPEQSLTDLFRSLLP